MSSKQSAHSRIAAIQMVSGADVEANLQQAEKQLRSAAERGAKLVVLPENFALLDSPALRPLAEREAIEQPLQTFLAGLSKELGVWIVAGSVPVISVLGEGREVVAPRVRAACLVFSDAGDLVARYDKVHLFDVEVADAHASYRESAICEAGEDLVVVDTPVGRLGLTICYDLRFPEQFQRLREVGAELISVPSAFTRVTGEAHWEVLLRARAIETQCYIIGADQGGVHSETRETWGQTMIVQPDGAIADQLATGPGVVMAEVDLAVLEEVRNRMPVLAHRQRSGF